ncbi:hypothetical protein BD769DRAFT_1490984, partial [Suillus cothurnatus]
CGCISMLVLAHKVRLDWAAGTRVFWRSYVGARKKVGGSERGWVMWRSLVGGKQPISHDTYVRDTDPDLIRSSLPSLLITFLHTHLSVHLLEMQCFHSDQWIPFSLHSTLPPLYSLFPHPVPDPS